VWITTIFLPIADPFQFAAAETVGRRPATMLIKWNLDLGHRVGLNEQSADSKMVCQFLSTTIDDAVDRFIPASSDNWRTSTRETQWLRILCCTNDPVMTFFFAVRLPEAVTLYLPTRQLPLVPELAVRTIRFLPVLFDEWSKQ
jgi:hypothetical protein